MKVFLGCLLVVLLCGTGESVMGPKYSRGEQEMPLGEESRGSYTVRVYTKEQQARLNVDKIGGADPKSCTFCQEIFGAFKIAVRVSNASVAELEKIGGAICSAAPKPVVKACDYVLKDVTKIRTAIVNGITKDKFCEGAGFCGSAEAPEVPVASEKCKICQELFGAFKIAVRVSNASVAELEKIGGAICSAAPKPVVKACDYVLKDVTKIRTAIVNGITKDKFCEDAGFCSSERGV